MSATAFDVVVLGGGPAGCATALALARAGIVRVLVVEAGHYDAVRIGESIPPDTRHLLDRLGVLKDFLAEKHEPSLGNCSSWGSDALGYNDFLFNPLGHGWHLDRRRFDRFLAGRAVEGGAQMRVGTRLHRAERHAEGFRLGLCADDGGAATVNTRFVVDATGVRATFARHRGARRVLSDQLLCVVGFFALSGGFPRMTMLEAVAYGWWYAAKLPDRRAAVAVASDPEIVKQRGLNRRDGWLASLAQTRHLAAELAGCRLAPDGLVTCAAPSFRLDDVAGDGWLAVGDAACAFDPISSQGIHKALADGLAAASAIAERLDGRADALDAYRSMAADRFEAYLTTRKDFYRQEQRWPTSAFWNRRCVSARGQRDPVRARAGPQSG